MAGWLEPVIGGLRDLLLPGRNTEFWEKPHGGYINHNDTADVEVAIQVSQTPSPRDVRAHSRVLMGNSPVWKVRPTLLQSESPLATV